jgi:hypothetical protein
MIVRWEMLGGQSHTPAVRAAGRARAFSTAQEFISQIRRAILTVANFPNGFECRAGRTPRFVAKSQDCAFREKGQIINIGGQQRLADCYSHKFTLLIMFYTKKFILCFCRITTILTED